MTISEQDLSIRANQFIQYMRDEFSSKPVSFARPNTGDHPEVTIIHGETREVISVVFTPEYIELVDSKYPVEEELTQDTLDSISQVVQNTLF